jgi:hypothetical protein
MLIKPHLTKTLDLQKLFENQYRGCYSITTPYYIEKYIRKFKPYYLFDECTEV